jgi:hypothetical protein
MNPEAIKTALDAIEAGDEAAALAILKEMIAASASGDEPAPTAEGEALAETPEPAPEEEGAALAALTKRFAAQQKQIAVLLAKVQSTDAANAAVELTERRALVADLVKSGAEFPAHAWQKDDKGEPTTTPSKRLLDEPIAELRSRVAAHKAAGPRGALTPPESGVSEIKLSKDEQAYCKKHDLTPEQFAAKKASSARKAK